MKHVIPWLFMLLAALFLLEKPAFAESKNPRVVVAVFTKDLNRQDLMLLNIQNLRKERPQATIEVVAFGPGLTLVTSKVDSSNKALSKPIAALAEQGVKFLACTNTMKAMKASKEDLLPRVGVVPSGIVHVIDRQQEGWAYFAPCRPRQDCS